MEDINLLFVREVEKYPPLYDYTLADYGRKNVVEKAWAEVGRKFKLTGNESKEKWRNLRNSLVKNIHSANRASARKKKAYYLGEAMQFVMPFLKVPCKTSGSLPEVPGNAPTQPDLPPQEGSLTEQPEATEQPLSPSRPSTPSSAPPSPLREERNQPASFSAKRKRRVKASRDTETDNIVAKYFSAKKRYLEAKQRVTTGQMDALKMFLLSLLPDLEALRPEKIRVFKRETLALIEQLSEEGCRNCSSPSLISTDSPSQSPVGFSLEAEPPLEVEIRE